jgi:hypothetical protein
MGRASRLLGRGLRAPRERARRGRRWLELSRAVQRGEVIGRHPLNVQVQTTSTCNGRCCICPYPESWHHEHPGTMDDALYTRVLDQLAGLGVEIDRFCPYLENEPLLDPRLFERVEQAVARLSPRVVELSTNAVPLDPGRLEDLVRVLSGIRHEIWVSFHGADARSYGEIMGMDFDLALERTLALVEAAQDHPLEIIIRGAGEPVPTMLRRRGSREQGWWFDEARYRAFWKEQFRRRGFRRLPRIVFFRYHNRAGQVAFTSAMQREVIRRGLRGFHCRRFDGWLHVLYNGELVLCCMDYVKETAFGDLSSEPLSCILASAQYRQLIARGCGLERSDRTFICKRCPSPEG